MARGASVSLVVPVILGLIIAILLYFSWGANAQSRRLKEENGDLKRELTVVRNERDNIQYRVNLLNDDIQQSKTAREEAEKELADNEDKASDMNKQLELLHTRVNQCEEDAKQFQERAGLLQSENTQLTGQLSSHQMRAQTCEDTLLSVQAKANDYDAQVSKNMQLQNGVQVLQQNNDDLNQQIADLNSRLQRAETQLTDCTLHNQPVFNQAVQQQQQALPAEQGMGAGFDLPAQDRDAPDIGYRAYRAP